MLLAVPAIQLPYQFNWYQIYRQKTGSAYAPPGQHDTKISPAAK
jgi:hypothetical protein